MDANKKAASGRVYQEFEPLTELVAEEDRDELLVYLPGFKKEQLRVQLTRTGNLIISGELPVGDNTYRRFQKTIPVSTNSDINKITAKFEESILYITQPKVIISAEKPYQEKPTSTEAPETQKPFVDEQKPPNEVKEDSSQKPASMTSPAELTDKTGNGLAKMAASVPQKEHEKQKEQETSDGKSRESSDTKNVSENAPETGENTNAKSVSEKTLKDEQTKKTAADEMMKGNTNQNDKSDTSNFAKKMDGRASGSDVGQVTKLKMPRKVMKLLLTILLAVALGMYLKNSLISWMKADN